MGLAMPNDGFSGDHSLIEDPPSEPDNTEDCHSVGHRARRVTHRKSHGRPSGRLPKTSDLGHNSGILAPLENLDDLDDLEVAVLSRAGRGKQNPNDARNMSPQTHLKKENILDFSASFVSASRRAGLGAVLSNAREDAGLTQSEVAKIMGTDHRAVRRIEKGDTNPTWETAERYAKAVGLQIYLGPREQ